MGVAFLGVWDGAGCRSWLVSLAGCRKRREVRFVKREGEGSLLVPDLVVFYVLPTRCSDRSLALPALIGCLEWCICLWLTAYCLRLAASCVSLS